MLMLFDASQTEIPNPTFNLLLPRSQCPQCQTPIAWFDNIPVLSYLWLRARCRHCHQKISWRYPAVEILSLCLSVLVALRFGFQWSTGAGLLLTWALIALTFIDLDHKLLPDTITLPFIWLGLWANVFEILSTAADAILGAIYGYLVLWCVYWVFKGITKKEGMGYGDFKLLAMLGAWLGWQSLPLIVLCSSFLGAVCGISLIVFQQRDKNIPIPFGPFLAIAGFIALLWGSELSNWYFKFAVS